MMRKLTFHVLLVLMAAFVWASCEDKKSAEMLRESTAIARQRTDSLLNVQKDSIQRAKQLAIRRADSLRRLDSLRRVYERSHFTIVGKVGGDTASIELRHGNELDDLSGTFKWGGRSVKVEGYFGDHITLTGSQRRDSIETLKVLIELTRVENDFSGDVTFEENGKTTTKPTILRRK